MNCPKCGKLLKINDVYCSNCGLKLCDLQKRLDKTSKEQASNLESCNNIVCASSELQNIETKYDQQNKKKRHIWINVVVSCSAVLIIAIVAAVTCDRPRSTAIEQLPVLEEGWVRFQHGGVVSIDYPDEFLELQSREYQVISDELSMILGLPRPDFVLQQRGLNEMELDAFQEYKRLIFNTHYLDRTQKVFKLNEQYQMDSAELAETLDMLIAESGGLLPGPNVFEYDDLRAVELNGMYPVLFSYKRQLDDNPVVQVKNYVFFNYDKIHYLILSYRVQDKESSERIFEKILDSLRLQE
ncbi:MAG: zinc ribbon domain-containing protein [Dehalococcoidales bacterium]